MAVRVRLRIKSRLSGRAVETSALVNTGFETEAPQLLIPLPLARQLGLYPPPPDALLVEFGTAGGPVRNYVIRDALEVSVLTDDREVGPVVCDAVISSLEEEVLVNDKLGEALGLVLLALGSGRWRFADDPPQKMRSSEPPSYWPP